MDPLNRAWTAAGTLHLQRKVIDPATGLEVRPCHTEAAKAKRRATYALARRPRRTRNACHVDALHRDRVPTSTFPEPRPRRSPTAAGPTRRRRSGRRRARWRGARVEHETRATLHRDRVPTSTFPEPRPRRSPTAAGPPRRRIERGKRSRNGPSSSRRRAGVQTTHAPRTRLTLRVSRRRPR